ncbi:hypothetical protein IMSAG249_00838 [Lachnospiraceae bacterium]|nr:hypothetical protein IMSAG249_00838 [Lachnospiraceae bacterium]
MVIMLPSVFVAEILLEPKICYNEKSNITGGRNFERK